VVPSLNKSWTLHVDPQQIEMGSDQDREWELWENLVSVRHNVVEGCVRECCDEIQRQFEQHPTPQTDEADVCRLALAEQHARCHGVVVLFKVLAGD
jgi:hypothetical protein